jgi:hypothetical protein
LDLRNYALYCMASMLSFLLCAPAIARAASVEELGQRCQKAREMHIAPLRAAAIEDCANRRRSSRSLAACERMHADFGAGGGTVDGGFRAPMFIDLPECVEYFAAQDRQRERRSRR